MTMTKRFLMGASVAAAMTITGAAHAQSYPTRPITVIIPFAGGSASDVVSRIMFNKMSQSMGQPIVVENKPGAGGNSGTALAAKAAPGYDMAKCIIKAINAVGKCINNDKRIEDKIKVVFLPNYRVSLAQRIVPAADLSEQISTAGKEASGTGNMKLALNGALTIGTLDGANVEIMEEVGEDNIFIFGLTVDEVHTLLKKGYNPQEYYMKNEELRAVVDWVGSNYFTPEEPPGVLSMLRDNLFYSDPFLCLADFESYSECQKKVDAAFRQKSHWAKMAILNTARVGKFSSDRAIREYARDIWRVEPVCV